MDDRQDEVRLMRADRAMKVTKIIMWIVGIFNLLMAAGLVLVFYGKNTAVMQILPESFVAFVDKALVYLLLYWLFILPASSGFGLGTAIFFLRDQKRIRIFDKSCVAFIVLFILSLAPSMLVVGSLVLNMFV